MMRKWEQFLRGFTVGIRRIWKASAKSRLLLCFMLGFLSTLPLFEGAIRSIAATLLDSSLMRLIHRRKILPLDHVHTNKSRPITKNYQLTRATGGPTNRPNDRLMDGLTDISTYPIVCMWFRTETAIFVSANQEWAICKYSLQLEYLMDRLTNRRKVRQTDQRTNTRHRLACTHPEPSDDLICLCRCRYIKSHIA